MKATVLFSAAILFFTTGSAQDSTSGQRLAGKPHTLHVFKIDGSVLKGYLYEATPQGISVTLSTKEPSALNTITAEQIDKFFLRRKGNIGKGALLGAIGGALIGTIIGASSPDDETCVTCLIDLDYSYTTEEKTAIGAAAGFFAGAGLGIIIGAVSKKKFIIQGKKENYQLKYQDIVERAMIQH